MSANKLAEAILANSLSQVTSQLNAGASVDCKLDIKCLSHLDRYRTSEDDDEIPSHIKVALLAYNGYAYPLHLAVVNLYHSLEKKPLRKSAFAILDLLLTRGADASKGSRYLILCNITGYHYKGFDSDSNSYTALDLALFFKRHPVSVYEEETHADMESAIQRIQQSKVKKSKAAIQTVPVMAEVATAWKSLLFSDKFSDVSFTTSDGVSIPAHRVVLAAASPYFDAAFNGPWQEASSGEWETTYPSDLIRPLLELIYTGIVAKDFFKEKDPLPLLRCVSEYDIQPAIKLATNACIEGLAASNVKMYLQAAHLHNNTKLKKACFGFIQSNAPRVLTDVGFIALSQEDPNLWSELSQALSPDKENAGNSSSSSRKKARVE